MEHPLVKHNLSLSNNRPISLFSNIDKTFERIVYKHLYNHFYDNDIFTSLQSGVIPGDSTVNQLAFFYDTFCKALDSSIDWLRKEYFFVSLGKIYMYT